MHACIGVQDVNLMIRCSIYLTMGLCLFLYYFIRLAVDQYDRDTDMPKVHIVTCT